MAAVRWIQMSLFLMLVLQFTAATRREPSFFTVTAGDEITLHCGNRSDPQRDAGSTEWLFSGFRSPETEILVREMSRNVTRRSDRLSVSADRSLVIKTVTVDDVGFYTCRKNVSGKQDDADIFLSVIDMVELKVNGKVVLNCSVLQYEDCRYVVEWLYDGEKEILSDIEISPPSCSATMTLSTSGRQQKPYESLTCKVTNTYTEKAEHFRYKCPPPVKKTDAIKKNPPEQQDFPYLLRGIVVSVGLAVLIISVVTVNILTKTKANKSETNDDTTLDNKEDESIVMYENIIVLSASDRLQ
ncbi:uncharacterized protein LOC111611406 isoform X1 [Xiphophorus maculatus]|uniref:uncharacterized protein LOC111611406 isoform X1 n=1 Tax=Xiphophorus maculatus TaxID=8083 RepID=UPI000C6EAEBA|nr:uncharacterized protein LOC111611406 isoform X1 [Xiphophorus maculatus]XP_023203845.1 uncharacterized protein LOC111611406 isoform X1 [Xiphophorus maculatus]